jgi:hypothetical protein
MRKISGRQVMPHSYCNMAQKYIHLSHFIIKTAHNKRQYSNKMYHHTNNSAYFINIVNEKMRHVYVKSNNNLSGVERQKAFEKFINNDDIDWRVFSV